MLSYDHLFACFLAERIVESEPIAKLVNVLEFQCKRTVVSKDSQP